MSESTLKWRKVRSQDGDNLNILSVRWTWMEHPISKKVLKRVVLDSADWINIVALTPGGESIMVKQYRFGTESCTVETPGGMVDPGETPLDAAKRELLEETGYTAQRWTSLGAVEPNPAIHPHLCHHFLARDAIRIQEPNPGEGEAIEVALYDQSQLREAIQDHSLRHTLALSALSRVFRLWELPYEIEINV